MNDRKALQSNQILIGIILLSVALRLAVALVLGDQVSSLPGIADQISYHELALRVLGGHGFTFGKNWWPATAANAPTAHWSYLYTFYLTAVYALVGPHPLAARVLQAILVGVLHPLLAYYIGQYIFGRAAGVAAAGLTALYAYHIYYSAALMTEPFYVTAVLASLYLTMRLAGRDTAPEENPSADRWLWRGLALGSVVAAAVLLRQVYLMIVPVLFGWMWWRSAGRQWKLLVTAALTLVAFILPFTIYNQLRFQRFVLLNTNAGFAFFLSNHPAYGTKFEPILSEHEYQWLIPNDLRGLDEAALDQALLRRGLQFVIDDPGRYLQLTLSRIPVYFMFWPSLESSLLSNLARVASFGLTWPLMLFGLVRALRRPVSPAGPGSLGPVILLGAFGLSYAGIHLLSWALIRYRLPVDAMLLVFAGSATADLMRRMEPLRKSLWRRAEPRSLKS